MNRDRAGNRGGIGWVGAGRGDPHRGRRRRYDGVQVTAVDAGVLVQRAGGRDRDRAGQVLVRGEGVPDRPHGQAEGADQQQ
jgi:hypothetical protein